MGADSECRALRRQGLLESFRSTRSAFARSGDFVRASKIELGIQLLLDQRVSDRMLDLMIHSAAVAARDAADVVTPRAA